MSSTTFYAKLKLTGNPSESVLLTFSNVKAADQWWELIKGNNWPGDTNIKSDNVKRENPQWFTWPNGRNGAKAVMKVLDESNTLKPVKGSYDWKLYDEAQEPVIPTQDASGQSDMSAMEKKIAELEARLAAAEKKSEASTAVATTNPAGADGTVAKVGSNWRGGPTFQGGAATHAMASDAFRMTMECKDRGDNRGFGMIFAQFFMEQRRIVGVKRRDEPPEAGYNSAELIKAVYEKAKELQDKGDDRPFGLIFADISMAYRRGKVQW